jgi:subtilisin family serine protease
MVNLLKRSLLGAGMAALVAAPAWAQGSSDDALSRRPAGVVPGQYIVVLQDDISNVRGRANEMAADYGLGLQRIYTVALKGFSAQVPAAALRLLENDPDVAYVEPDQFVQAFAQSVPTGIRRIFADDNSNIGVDGIDTPRVDVDVAVIDTGTGPHNDLNVVSRVNCAQGGPFGQSCTSGGNDDNGHGTHVGGTIGAIDNGNGVVGVAPGARLWSVKVLNKRGSGYMSWIVAGIDYVTANAGTIEVANMSLGCECTSSALNTAITNSVAAGVTYAVAAGNSDKNAATFSPANHPDVITVSALADFNGEPGGGAPATCRSDVDDTLANFSNFGATVEVAAPGVCILSTWLNGGYNTISGTSMASPHVAGAAALLAATDGTYTPAAIRNTIKTSGNSDWTDDSGDGVKEPLLDVSNENTYSP